MTLVIYEPDGPAIDFIGHAGAGLYGHDPVCAALSILMYTLIEAVPGAAVKSGDGYCRIDAGAFYPVSSVKQNVSTSFDVILGGLRLLAGSFPQYVQLKEKTRTEPSISGSVRERRKEGTDMELSKRFEEAECSELLPAR